MQLNIFNVKLNKRLFNLCNGQVKQAIPTFHTRAMRRSLMQRYGRVTSNVKPAILRNLYRELTGDMSAATNEHEAQIDERV